MRKGALARILVALLAGALVMAVPGVGFAAGDGDGDGGGRKLTAKLVGETEVPGPGDPDGKGRARVTLDGREVCFALEWEGIGAPHMAHIHEGPEGVAGPIVVLFFETMEMPLPDTITMVGGCIDQVDPDLVDAIKDDPEGFYVNIHNPEFPAGAIRGQLHH